MASLAYHHLNSDRAHQKGDFFFENSQRNSTHYGDRYRQHVARQAYDQQQKSSRHLHLQSRVESLSGGTVWDSFRDDFTEVPLIHEGGREKAVGYAALNHGPSRTVAFVEPSTIQDEHYSAQGVSYRQESPLLDSKEAVSRDVRSCEALGISPVHEALFIGVVIMAEFMTFAGFGQALAPMHIIAVDLGLQGPGQQAWFLSAYALAIGACTLVSHRLGDIVGHKRVFVFGFFFLGCWSAFAGFSAYVKQPVFFDVCRAFQGVGASLLVPNAIALLGRAFPPSERSSDNRVSSNKRALAFSLFGAMAVWGLIVGALSAGIFGQLAWWPWAFFTYAVAAWILATAAILVIPQALAHEAQFKGRPDRPKMDYTGLFLGPPGLVLVGVALQNAPIYGWTKPFVCGALIVGILHLIVFVWYERRAASPWPLLPIRYLSSIVIYNLSVLNLCWSSFSIWIYYSWRFLCQVRKQTPLVVAAEWAPALLCGLLAAGATKYLLARTPLEFSVLLGLCAFFVAELLTATQPVDQPYWAQMFFAVLLIPFGMDLSLLSVTSLLSKHLPHDHHNLSTSLVYSTVFLSIATALGLAGTIEAAVTGSDGPPDPDGFMGIRCALFAGVALAGMGVILAAIGFGRALLRERWELWEDNLRYH